MQVHISTMNLWNAAAPANPPPFDTTQKANEMAYGDYNGPDKNDKGLENGSCSRIRCQAPNAEYYSHFTREWYCHDCAIDIGQDPVNLEYWNNTWYPKLKHPPFETRKQINEREGISDSDQTIG